MTKNFRDRYGNIYVRPTVCSHWGCPPDQCLQKPIEPLPPCLDGMLEISSERLAGIQQDWEEWGRSLAARRKTVDRLLHRRMLVSLAIGSLPGVGLLALKIADWKEPLIEILIVAAVSTLVFTVLAFFLSLQFIPLPEIPVPEMGQGRRQSGT